MKKHHHVTRITYSEGCNVEIESKSRVMIPSNIRSRKVHFGKQHLSLLCKASIFPSFHLKPKRIDVLLRTNAPAHV
jgi:hypothetical protein